ncbi:MAG: Outer membrane protein assembly factor BamB [Phycisphaerae bacterium]|nr:Outer membrane protein assembly factor BamB [Phycisphaerae bacterium]
MPHDLLLPLLCACLSQSAGTPPGGERYWHQWRGPLANGTALHGDPPTEWSESKNVRWKVAIPGRGHSSPIVWKDRIYLLTAIKTEQVASTTGNTERSGGWAERPADTSAAAMAFNGLPQEQDAPPPERRRRGGGGGRGGGEKPKNVHEFAVLCLNRADGKTIWQKAAYRGVPHDGTHPDGTFASASPITDGDRVYASFGSAGLFCVDMQGNPAWNVDLGDMRTRSSFGEGSSPALFGDTLVVNWDHEGDDFIVALDARTGRERWRKPRDEPTTWSTPLIVDVKGKPQVITTGTNRVISYDLASGDVVWEDAGLTANVIPSAVYQDGMLVVMSGFRGAALRAIRLAEARGDLSKDGGAIAWKYDQDTPYVPSPLLYDGGLYFLENNRAMLTCLNARSGEKRFGPQRIEGVQGVYASPVAAAGRVYVVGRDGKTAVLKHGGDYSVLAVNTLDDGFDASPAIVDHELYLRGREHLYCIAAP